MREKVPEEMHRVVPWASGLSPDSLIRTDKGVALRERVRRVPFPSRQLKVPMALILVGLDPTAYCLCLFIRGCRATLFG